MIKLQLDHFQALHFCVKGFKNILLLCLRIKRLGYCF